MIKRDKRIDRYIARSQPFARPILRHLRTVVQQACPAVEETVKWGMPAFDYKGMVMCSMAAFKHHAVFGFWKERLMADPNRIFTQRQTAMGGLGKITSLNDLPSGAILKKYIKAAMRLNDAGIKAPANPKHPRKPLRIPRYLNAALQQQPKAQSTFQALSYSHKKEYVEWLTEAKQAATRQKRLTSTLQWLAAGKSRHWKYAG